MSSTSCQSSCADAPFPGAFRSFSVAQLVISLEGALADLEFRTGHP